MDEILVSHIPERTLKFWVDYRNKAFNTHYGVETFSLKVTGSFATDLNWNSGCHIKGEHLKALICI